MARKDVSDVAVCLAYWEARQRGGVWPYEVLEEWTGQPFKVCYRAMERAHDRGLVEYGVSLRAGWITDKGKRLLMAKE